MIRKNSQIDKERPVKSITLKLPEDLIIAIDAQAFSTGTNRTEVVVKALEKSFKTVPILAVTTSDEHLINRLEILAQKVAKLEEGIDENLLESITKRISILENLASSQKDVTEPQPPISSRQSKRQVKAETPISQPKKSTAGSSKSSTQTKTKQESKSTKVANTAKTQSPLQTDEWLSVKEAFLLLGGNPNQSNSTVSSRDGSRAITFNRFRVLNASDYKLFGLEFRPERRHRKQPCLKLIGK